MNQEPIITAEITTTAVPPITNLVPQLGEAQSTSAAIQQSAEVVPPKSSHHSKTLHHLKSIRLYSETKERVEKISVVRVIAANTKPIYEHILRTTPLVKMRFLTDFVDRTTLATVELAEKCVPSIKTVSTSNIVDAVKYPIVTPLKLTKDVKDATVDFVTYFAYRPYHNQILKFRGFYNKKIIDTKNKPLVRGMLDPFISPLNDSVETKVKKIFPNMTYHQKETFCCETSRSLSLAYIFMEGSKHRSIHLMGETLMLPFKMTKDFDSALNKHLDMQSDMGFRSTLKATNGAIIELKKGMFQTLKGKTISRNKTSNLDHASDSVGGDQENSDAHVLPINLPTESQGESEPLPGPVASSQIISDNIIPKPELPNVTFAPTY